MVVGPQNPNQNVPRLLLVAAYCHILRIPQRPEFPAEIRFVYRGHPAAVVVGDCLVQISHSSRTKFITAVRNDWKIQKYIENEINR